MNIRAFITLMFLFMLMGASAQNVYWLKECDLSFSSPDNFVATNNNAGYSIFKNPSIEVSMCQVRLSGVLGIEDELKQHFTNNEYSYIEKGKLVKSAKQKSIFSFANRSGYTAQFAKGLILKNGKAYLIEIKYDPTKISQAREIIESFSSDKKQSYAAQVDKQTVPNPIPSVEKVKTLKYPEVNNPNLVKLTHAQKQEFLDTHNRWRSDVGVPPLVWSDDLENFAADWAVKKGEENCNMEHRPDNSFGENLFWSSGMEFSPKYVVDSWGSEIKDYHNEVVGQSNGVVGHYTQVVWRTTTEVGCAAFQCGSALIVVCNYNPPGNYVGQHPY